MNMDEKINIEDGYKSHIQGGFIIVAIVYAIAQFAVFTEYLFGFSFDRMDDILFSIVMMTILQHYTNYIVMIISSVVKKANTKFVMDIIGLVFNVISFPFFWFVNLFLGAEGTHNNPMLSVLCIIYASFIVVYICKIVIDYRKYRREKIISA